MPRLQYRFQRASEFNNRSKRVNTERAAERRVMGHLSHYRYHDLSGIEGEPVIRNPRKKPLIRNGRKP